MTLYGDLDQVKIMLRGAESITFGADTDARLAEIQKAVSLLIEQKTGRTFGDSVSSIARIVFSGPGSLLILPVPVRSVSLVEIGGAASAAGATGFTNLATSSYILDPIDQYGQALGIRLLTGDIWGDWSQVTPYSAMIPVRVTASWSDQDDDANVPADITYAANYLIAERLKMQSASPAGFSGPDGNTVPIRNAWNDSMVKDTLGKYQVRRVPVF